MAAIESFPWEATGLPTPLSATPIGGGCINSCWEVRTEDGGHFFLKTHSAPPPNFFSAEARGLQAIDRTGAIRCPKVIYCDEFGLVLEYVSTRPPRNESAWQRFGENLAHLHQHIAPEFGWIEDNFCGTTPQINTPRGKDGCHFFARQRLYAQAQRALTQGLLTPALVDQVEKLGEKLPDLIPEQPASLIHGDLWRGNLMFDTESAPVIFDPAAYYGWAEAELAMTMLFGRLPEACYQAYEATRPTVKGWQTRADIYNLYHLLNHLNLFGLSYLSDVQSILTRYV